MKVAKNLVEYSEMYNMAVNDPEIKRKFEFYMSEVMDEAGKIGRAKREGESIGLAKGEYIGIEKGQHQKALEAAGKLKLKGLTDNLIAEALDLPIETVKNL